MNLLIIMFFVKFVLSIKHLILISSLQLFILLLLNILCDECIYSILYMLFYSVTTIYILWDSQGHIDYFIPFYLVDLNSNKLFIIISAILLIVY